MIDLAILGLLEETDLHGYELRKRLGELPGTRAAVSFGSLYPALARLERASHVKAVTTATVSVPAAPMSGSLAGELAAFRAHRRNRPQGSRSSRGTRGKKVYGITDQGRQRLHDLLADDGIVDDRGFALRLVFCHHLTSTERLALFERRRAELIRQSDQQQQRVGQPRRLNTYLRSLLERDTQAISADLAWIERLIAAERGETIPAAPTQGDAADHDRGHAT